MVSCFLVVALLASSFGAGCAEGYQANVLNATQGSRSGDVDMQLLQPLASVERAVTFTIEVELKGTPIVSSKASINVWAAANVDAFKEVVLNTFKARTLPCGLPTSLGTLAQLNQNAMSVLQPFAFITVTGLPKCSDLATFMSKSLLVGAMTTAIQDFVTTTAPATLYIVNPVTVTYEPDDTTFGGASSDDLGPIPTPAPAAPAPAGAGVSGASPPPTPAGSAAPGPATTASAPPSPAAPGPSPSISEPPTAAPTAYPAGVPAPPAAGKGDPHLVNLHGQHFDLQQPGVHDMIVIPAFAEKNGALLYVQALVEKKGSKCTDMYFTMINVTGKWVGAQGPNGMDAGTSVQYFAERSQEDIAWKRYGTVSLKVAWGHTPEGVQYLNLLAKNLAHAGHIVGGLLGEDDHTEAATPIPGCRKTGDV